MPEELKFVRDAKGRIVTRTGTVPNAGRPRSDDVERLRSALRKSVDDETLEAFARALAKKIAKGNRGAAEFVFDRLLGKPAVTQNVNVSGELSAFMAAWQQITAEVAPPALPPVDPPPQLPPPDDADDDYVE